MRRLRNQRGQMTIEAVLLLVIALAFAKVGTGAIKDQDFLRKMVSGPWSYLQGMIQNGVWAEGTTGNDIHWIWWSRRTIQCPSGGRLVRDRFSRFDLFIEHVRTHHDIYEVKNKRQRTHHPTAQIKSLGFE